MIGELINIWEILEKVSIITGRNVLTVWSSVHGHCSAMATSEGDNRKIKLRGSFGSQDIDEYGRLIENGVPIIFPSFCFRDWDSFLDFFSTVHSSDADLYSELFTYDFIIEHEECLPYSELEDLFDFIFCNHKFFYDFVDCALMIQKYFNINGDETNFSDFSKVHDEDYLKELYGGDKHMKGLQSDIKTTVKTELGPVIKKIMNDSNDKNVEEKIDNKNTNYYIYKRKHR